ncbi:hypothetical protein BJV74DRAFT_745813, partial [Russula compacta]
AKWSTSFLPTLYACLGSSSNPWKPYEDGSSMLDMIQGILDMVYPNSGYHVRISDKIYSMAKDHLNKKWTYFGCEAIKIVTTFFRTEKFARRCSAIVEYANWATHSDGPGLWGSPTPIDCVVPRNHPDYVKPDDLFESVFVVNLVSPFIKWCKGLCHDYGHLKGAFAMASAGIERGFRMYHSSERVDVGQFSWELVGQMIEDYANNMTIMSQQRWANLMDIFGAP